MLLCSFVISYYFFNEIAELIFIVQANVLWQLRVTLNVANLNLFNPQTAGGASGSIWSCLWFFEKRIF